MSRLMNMFTKVICKECSHRYDLKVVLNCPICGEEKVFPQCTFVTELKNGQLRCNLTRAGQFGQMRMTCPGEPSCVMYAMFYNHLKDILVSDIVRKK